MYLYPESKACVLWTHLRIHVYSMCNIYIYIYIYTQNTTNIIIYMYNYVQLYVVHMI